MFAGAARLSIRKRHLGVWNDGWTDSCELCRAETVGGQASLTRRSNTRRDGNRVLRRLKEVAGQLLRHGEHGESGITEKRRIDASHAVVGLVRAVWPNSGLFLCPISLVPL